VGELIAAAGGEVIFPELRNHSRAPDRAVTGDEILRHQPDIIIASWRGKQASLNRICQQPAWTRFRLLVMAVFTKVDPRILFSPDRIG
jgi:iron complex transport system substrate-binding protein